MGVNPAGWLFVSLLLAQRPPFPFYGVLALYRVHYTPVALLATGENEDGRTASSSSPSSVSFSYAMS